MVLVCIVIFAAKHLVYVSDQASFLFSSEKCLFMFLVQFSTIVCALLTKRILNIFSTLILCVLVILFTFLEVSLFLLNPHSRICLLI